ncbi:glycosyl hydrolase family 18 protein [Sphingobacterium sp. HJSM2_6]|uniref:glycosyl hydrolase family 18 protein n=1 Tax=Sphingobacterium sp. HJSM2_6 TaxID=3366264 RepID=UPI003BBCF1EE
MKIIKRIASLGLNFLFFCLISCQKNIENLGPATKGDFEILQSSPYQFTLKNTTAKPTISRWRIPNLGKTFEGDTVSVYIGSSGTYDVILYPTSKGGIDSVVKQIEVIENDPELYNKESSIVVSGWYNDGWNQTSHQVYLNNDKLFSEVNPYWYNLGTDSQEPGNSVADGSIYERPYVFNAQQIAQVRSRGDLMIPTIGDMSRNQINEILASEASQENLINNLTQKALYRNYDGWDLNFEHANEIDKDKFSAFVKKLGKALKNNHKILDVTIGGIPNELEESYWIFDYNALNIPEVRYIKIMAYDQYLRGTPNLNPVSE